MSPDFQDARSCASRSVHDQVNRIEMDLQLHAVRIRINALTPLSIRPTLNGKSLLNPIVIPQPASIRHREQRTALIVARGDPCFNKNQIPARLPRARALQQAPLVVLHLILVGYEDLRNVPGRAS